jgi:putative effector of murein hydrolase LrgA (UPF0299 family)
LLGPLTILLSCQLAGEVLARSLSLPIPGPVIGLVLLAVLLLAFSGRPGAGAADLTHGDLARTAQVLVGALGLLFVPTGVGVVQQLNLLGTHAVGILITVFASSIITMLATVGTFLLVKRLLVRAP